MADRIIRRADWICAGLHFLAWLAAVAIWTLNWRRTGPAPTGPIYYGAEKFIHHIDALVYGVVHELTVVVAKAVSAWLSLQIGACLTVTFAVLILLAGTVQWFLLG